MSLSEFDDIIDQLTLNRLLSTMPFVSSIFLDVGEPDEEGLFSNPEVHAHFGAVDYDDLDGCKLYNLVAAFLGHLTADYTIEIHEFEAREMETNTDRFFEPEFGRPLVFTKDPQVLIENIPFLLERYFRVWTDTDDEKPKKQPTITHTATWDAAEEKLEINIRVIGEPDNPERNGELGRILEQVTDHLLILCRGCSENSTMDFQVVLPASDLN